MRFLIVLTLFLAVARSAPLEENELYHPESREPAQDGSYNEISSERPASDDDGLYHPESLGPEDDGSYHEISSERPTGEDDGQYHPEPSDSENIEAQNNLIDLNAPHSTFIDPFNYVKVDVPLSQHDSAVYTFYSGRSNPYEYVPIQVKTEKHEIPVAPLVEARILPTQVVESQIFPIVQQQILHPQVVPIVQPRILDSGIPLVQQQLFPTGAVVPGLLPLNGDLNVVVNK